MNAHKKVHETGLAKLPVTKIVIALIAVAMILYGTSEVARGQDGNWNGDWGWEAELVWDRNHQPAIYTDLEHANTEWTIVLRARSFELEDTYTWPDLSMVNFELARDGLRIWPNWNPWDICHDEPYVPNYHDELIDESGGLCSTPGETLHVFEASAPLVWGSWHELRDQSPQCLWTFRVEIRDIPESPESLPQTYTMELVPTCSWLQGDPELGQNYLSNYTEYGPRFAVHVVSTGDISGPNNVPDGEVGLADLAKLLSNYGEYGEYGDGDFNWDGEVGLDDLGILLTHMSTP